MLFLLTGGVQTGKTRWLEQLIAELADDGVESQGVVAPGVWCQREGEEVPGERPLGSGQGEYEKLGIDNVLLPGGERLPFARRRDLARQEGTFDPASQSAAAQLAWEISDDAIARVNAHLDALGCSSEEDPPLEHNFLAVEKGTNVSRETLWQDQVVASAAMESAMDFSADCATKLASECATKPAADCATMLAAECATKPAADCATKPTAGSIVDFSPASSGSPEVPNALGAREEGAAENGVRPALLVVDELGRLELEHGRGLTSALDLIGRGATARFPHALVVVRAWLRDGVEARFADAWGGTFAIEPGDAARDAVRAAFSLAPFIDKKYH
ncbi:hypothetical protein [Gordonibacter sp.]|uniref:hypothetical protein n=1 Tax=Gordonibacter sp. TaxID=1968902 RepID=UPI002FC62484